MGNFQAKLNDLFEKLAALFFILLGVRAVMLILNLPLIEVPIIDQILFLFWDLIKAAISMITGSKFIPRVGT